MPSVRLTEKMIETFPAPEGSARVWYADTELSGFGLRVGATARTFQLMTYVHGRRSRITIGRFGAIRPDGQRWSVVLARRRAQEMLGTISGGGDPAPKRRAPEQPQPQPPTPAPGGITLRDAMAIHVKGMRKDNASKRSIDTLTREVERLLSARLDRPIVELTALVLSEEVDRIKAATKPRRGSANEPGAALTNRLLQHVSGVWNSADALHEFPQRNPATPIGQHKLKPRKQRIPDDGFPEWYRRVQELHPVRRDLNIVLLYTGMRSSSGRPVRWEDVDFKRKLLQVDTAKGDQPYTLPLTDTIAEILRKRKAENARLFAAFGGDHGWVFPSLSRKKPYKVQPVAEPKEQRVDYETGEKVRYLEGPHTLRKTFNSVAIEIGIQQGDREALMNHAGHGVNIKHYGFPQNWDHLRTCMERIDEALWARIRRRQPTRSAASQRSTSVQRYKTRRPTR